MSATFVWLPEGKVWINLAYVTDVQTSEKPDELRVFLAMGQPVKFGKDFARTNFVVGGPDVEVFKKALAKHTLPNLRGHSLPRTT